MTSLTDRSNHLRPFKELPETTLRADLDYAVYLLGNATDHGLVAAHALEVTALVAEHTARGQPLPADVRDQILCAAQPMDTSGDVSLGDRLPSSRMLAEAIGANDALEVEVVGVAFTNSALAAAYDRAKEEAMVGQASPKALVEEQSGHDLRAALRRALQHLNDIEDGRAPRYDNVERLRFAQLAMSALNEPASPGLEASLSESHRLAHAMANSMAALDGAKGQNPFVGTNLASIYASAQRWQSHLAKHFERPTLQTLLNARAEFVAAVDRAALALHEAQRAESTAYAAKGGATTTDTYQSAHRLKKQATEEFVEAVSALREFRAAPTQDPQLRRTFQDLEALELVVSKTERSIRDAATAGMRPDELDHRDLRHNQMALKAFLQQHDATIPLNTPATADRRQERQDNRATAAHRM